MLLLLGGRALAVAGETPGPPLVSFALFRERCNCAAPATYPARSYTVFTASLLLLNFLSKFRRLSLQYRQQYLDRPSVGEMGNCAKPCCEVVKVSLVIKKANGVFQRHYLRAKPTISWVHIASYSCYARRPRHFLKATWFYPYFMCGYPIRLRSTFPPPPISVTMVWVWVTAKLIT